MQTHRQYSGQNLQQLASTKDDMSGRSYNGRGDWSGNNSSLKDTSVHQEALLKAQLIELRRDLANSQHAAHKAQEDLQQRQSLIRSAAGEARKEVLSLRSKNEDLRHQLAETCKKVQELEEDLELVSAKLAEALDRDDDGEIEALRVKLGQAEKELEELRSDDRVHKALNAALQAQVEALVGESSEDKQKLAALQSKGGKSTEGKNAVDHEEALQTKRELESLQRDYNQALTQIEALQNELNVAIEESSQDRVSAAARILELERDSSASHPASNSEAESPRAAQRGKATDVPASPSFQGLKLLLSPDQKREGSPNRTFGRSRLLLPFLDDDESSPKNGLLAAKAAPVQEVTEERLLTELRVASSYLQDFSSRLQEASICLTDSCSEDKRESVRRNLDAFKQALEAVESKLGGEQKHTSSDRSEAVSIEAKENDSPEETLEVKAKPNLAIKLVGGLLLAPGLVAAALFLPRSR